MTDLSDLREAECPQAPKLPDVTERQRAQGRHLAAIHRLHLREIAQIRGLIERIDADRAAAPDLAAAVSGLSMRRNLATFGALCGRECHALFFHHDAEEYQLFPVVDRLPGFAPLVAKLRQEHTVIHALIDALGAGAEALVASPDDHSYAALRDTFRRLAAALASHFHYEETELEEALGTLGIL